MFSDFSQKTDFDIPSLENNVQKLSEPLFWKSKNNILQRLKIFTRQAKR